MNINDLDQNKTEQSIASENARLDTCRVTLERLKQENVDFAQKYHAFKNKYLNIDVNKQKIYIDFIRELRTLIMQLKEI